jgi:uncharacterized protein YndB with AHSA1/START domain
VIVHRSRTVAAPVEDVWRIVRDPYHLPRWWPRTERVEGVNDAGWTSVLTSDRGRAVRADYRVQASQGRERRRWAQELAGSPFERIFAELVTELVLTPAGPQTLVGIEVTQRPRGWARFGGFMLRRATRRQLDAALAGLAGLVEGR